MQSNTRNEEYSLQSTDWLILGKTDWQLSLNAQNVSHSPFSGCCRRDYIERVLRRNKVVLCCTREGMSSFSSPMALLNSPWTPSLARPWPACWCHELAWVSSKLHHVCQSGNTKEKESKCSSSQLCSLSKHREKAIPEVQQSGEAHRQPGLHEAQRAESMVGIHRVQHLWAGERNCPKTAWGRKGVRDRALKIDERRGDGWGEWGSHPNSTENLQTWTMYCYFSHLWNGDREYLLKISEV